MAIENTGNLAGERPIPDPAEILATPDILQKIETVCNRHFSAENDRNEARRLERDADGVSRFFVAQWNDDAHHALHVLLTGERDGYYADYADRPIHHLGRCLAEGFAYQGDPSPFRDGALRGEPSAALPPTAFVCFLQNHDQIGNRAFGDRLVERASPEAVRAAYPGHFVMPFGAFSSGREVVRFRKGVPS